jgi:hypothetical protein
MQIPALAAGGQGKEEGQTQSRLSFFFRFDSTKTCLPL